MKQPRTFDNTVVLFQNFDSLVRELAKKLEEDGVVHPKSAVRQYQRDEIDSKNRNFKENLEMAYDHITLILDDSPDTDGLENMLTEKKEEFLATFIQTTAFVDLETECRDKVFEELKHFADREITAKKIQHQLVTENRELRKKGVLTNNT